MNMLPEQSPGERHIRSVVKGDGTVSHTAAADKRENDVKRCLSVERAGQ